VRGKNLGGGGGAEGRGVFGEYRGTCGKIAVLGATGKRGAIIVDPGPAGSGSSTIKVTILVSFLASKSTVNENMSVLKFLVHKISCKVAFDVCFKVDTI
jgi:hypothetical protein